MLQEAHDMLRTVIAGLDESAWTSPTPCDQWNVAQVLRHAAGDQLAYTAALTGHGGPAENPFTPSAGPPAGPRAFLESALTSTAAAFAAVGPEVKELPSPLPLGPLPAEIVVGAAALDAAVHAWDIAVATGRPAPLTADLAGRLMPAATTIADPLRGFAFAAAQPARPGDDAAARLLRYLGRDPRWARS
ncbi:TIGR03086 family metal-binding protein [Actinoplanes sp. NPDC051343]|uniref:TIGR03086 family metal-binding protein n=1 Tax=Actinoplanes sp. NPDC051343 TaxID=3363906 RepID=UPI00378D3D7E